MHVPSVIHRVLFSVRAEECRLYTGLGTVVHPLQGYFRPRSTSANTSWKGIPEFFSASNSSKMTSSTACRLGCQSTLQPGGTPRDHCRVSLKFGLPLGGWQS